MTTDTVAEGDIAEGAAKGGAEDIAEDTDTVTEGDIAEDEDEGAENNSIDCLNRLDRANKAQSLEDVRACMEEAESQMEGFWGCKEARLFLQMGCCRSHKWKSPPYSLLR